MGKAFSVASWNVKHFKKKNEPVSEERVKRVFTYLNSINPDVIALYEVEGKEVYNEIVTKFPGYVFQITEGKETQEILVGVRSSLTCFITQKTEFKSGVPYMRPGQLATIRLNDVDYCLVFLHLASFPEPRGFGLRDDMLYKAIKFRHVLDKAAGVKHQSYYIFLGDLNTMGMKYPFERDISPKHELDKWDERAARYYGMRRLTKTVDMTWRGTVDGKLETSNLDHVYASNNIKFNLMKKNQVEADVDVKGWVDFPTEAERDEWTDKYSDHSLLYFEVQQIID